MEGRRTLSRSEHLAFCRVRLAGLYLEYYERFFSKGTLLLGWKCRLLGTELGALKPKENSDEVGRSGGPESAF